jgi:hypothetical protein
VKVKIDALVDDGPDIEILEVESEAPIVPIMHEAIVKAEDAGEEVFPLLNLD